jgi:hypothetical protein
MSEMGFPTRKSKRVEIVSYPELSEREKEIVEYYSRPAHTNVIQFHLSRLFGHKHLKGDETQKAIQANDYLNALKEYTELEIFEMTEYFLKRYKSDFAPNLSVVLDYLDGQRSFN